MSKLTANRFFDDVNFVSIVSTVKGIMTSDGTMSTLLDFERVLDECDLYAFRNWTQGELVQGPINNRYSVKCIFMWPYKLMPDPSGMKRLLSIGCNLKIAKDELEVPIEVTNYDDFVAGTMYPKMIKRKVWYIQIEIPKELMNEIKEGSIDLADQTIDLQEIEQAYEEDLDNENVQPDSEAGMTGPELSGGMPMPGPVTPPI